MKLHLTIFLSLLGIAVMSQEIRVKAESGKLSKALVIADSLKGFSGNGYVANFGNNDDSLLLTIPVKVPGQYDIFVGYASPGGTKIINVDVNGIRSSLEIPQMNNSFREALFATLQMKAGNNVVTITPNWRYFNIDYVSLKKNESKGIPFRVADAPVNPGAGQSARKLYSFLQSNFLNKCISGVMTLKPLSAETNEIPYLKNQTGKEPALLGLDFMDHTGKTPNINNPDLVKDAISWHQRNGILAICWHWRDPLQTTNAFYTKSTKFDVTKVSDPESDEYKAMIRDMDIVAGYLKELQSAGVPVLWRPLHEAAGGWFWWGAKGPEACVKLWQLMYDRFTNHHKLNNLIWVWTTTDDSKAMAWYPGDKYVDILGMDIYPGEYQHGSQVIAFNRVKELFGGRKMVTLSECGSIPHPDVMQNDGAYWSWFMPWYGTHTKDAKHNSADDWKKILGSDFVITLDEMPKL